MGGSRCVWRSGQGLGVGSGRRRQGSDGLEEVEGGGMNGTGRLDAVAKVEGGWGWDGRAVVVEEPEEE